jgi:hypothetical protein
LEWLREYDPGAITGATGCRRGRRVNMEGRKEERKKKKKERKKGFNPYPAKVENMVSFQ